MIFNSFPFVVFFFVLFPVYYLVRGRASRQWILLAASLFFYGWWDWRCLGLIGGVTLTSYFAVWLFDRSPRHKKLVLTASLVLLLGVLGVFKYFNFFAENLVSLAGLFGMRLSYSFVRIILPIGISFYTFQAISYVVDVYRGELPAETNFRKVALYITFFPHLVAGPIVRAAFFIPQMDRDVRLTARDLGVGVQLFLVGLIYKVVFSDRIADHVNVIYGALNQYDNASVWMASLGFYAQIYFDFAGYSTMAIGIARLFGYRLCDNFDFPYVSRSITEFWRRWHISLSSWLRDYLYIPLGGNRRGVVMQYRNLMLTMLLGGLWHGASWNFIFWGGLHGAALAVHKLLMSRRQERGEGAVRAGAWLWLYPALSWTGTQLFVLLCWVPFRLPHFGDTLQALRALFFLRPDAGLLHTNMSWLLLLPVLADTFLLSRKRPLAAGAEAEGGALVLWRYALLGIVLAVVLLLTPLAVKPFIYFQF